MQARQKYDARDYEAVVALLEPYKDEKALPPLVFTVLGGAYIELGRFQEAQALLDPVAAGEAAGPPLLLNAALLGPVLSPDPRLRAGGGGGAAALWVLALIDALRLARPSPPPPEGRTP